MSDEISFTQDWSFYLEDSVKEKQKESEQADERGIIYLDDEQISQFTSRLSGKTLEGMSKVIISYQTFAMEDPEEAKEQIYTLNKASIELSYDQKNPGYYVLDIIFQGYDDPELKMLWGRLQRHKKNEAEHGEKNWIFYFNILETSSITSQTVVRDTLLTCNAFNPLIFYLTREIPNMLAEDREVEGELQGGNIIRMLISEKLLTFQISDEIDTSRIKGEVLREAEDQRFLDSQEDAKTQ